MGRSGQTIWPLLSAADLTSRQQLARQALPARAGASYWRDVWRRLRANPSAMVSLSMIIALLLFTLLGPLLWPQDPQRQLLGQASQGPQGWREAKVVIDTGPWEPTREILPPDQRRSHAKLQGLRVLSAHTAWVRLLWQPVVGAEHYLIYRHTRAPAHRDDLGLPLGETWREGQIGYEDRLQLETRPYFYTVVPVRDGRALSEGATIEVRPSMAVAFMQGQLQGLIPLEADPGQWQGRSVRLDAHPFGTDYLGRDILARLMEGARVSLFIGIVAPLLFSAIGIVYGAVAGFVGGRVDEVMMRFADFVIALPFLLFMILFRVAFGIEADSGQNGIAALLLALVVLSWPATARLVRGQVLQLREEAYVDAARLFGAGRLYLIRRHMLPNVLAVVLVSLSFAIPSAIFTEAFLSFIGMGVTPPTPSWGSMSNDGMKTLLSHPHELFFPSLFISLAVLSFNLFGDALRDAMDARLREQR